MNLFFPGAKIEEMLTKWKVDYSKLENDHQYIQWYALSLIKTWETS